MRRGFCSRKHMPGSDSKETRTSCGWWGFSGVTLLVQRGMRGGSEIGEEKREQREEQVRRRVRVGGEREGNKWGIVG